MPKGSKDRAYGLRYTEEEKEIILKDVEILGIRKAAKKHGVGSATICRWKNPDTYKTEKYKQRTQNWAKENKEKWNKIRKRWREENKDEVNAKFRERQANDIQYKLAKNLRVRLRDALQGRCKSAKTLELLGCTPDELKLYLESQFKEGMSWDNYGVPYNVESREWEKRWVIDHIIPVSSFDLEKAEEQRKCFHYTNLQPLWGLQNLLKGDSLPTNQ